MSTIMRSIIGTLAALFSIQSLATWAIKDSPSKTEPTISENSNHEITFKALYKVGIPGCSGGTSDGRGGRKS
jgi:hypothetical protein